LKQSKEINASVLPLNADIQTIANPFIF